MCILNGSKEYKIEKAAKNLFCPVGLQFVYCQQGDNTVTYYGYEEFYTLLNKV